MGILDRLLSNPDAFADELATKRAAAAKAETDFDADPTDANFDAREAARKALAPVEARAAALEKRKAADEAERAAKERAAKTERRAKLIAESTRAAFIARVQAEQGKRAQALMTEVIALVAASYGLAASAAKATHEANALSRELGLPEVGLQVVYNTAERALQVSMAPVVARAFAGGQVAGRDMATMLSSVADLFDRGSLMSALPRDGE